MGDRPEIFVDHIAFLCENIERSREQFPGYKSDEIQEFPKEGTREQYLWLSDDGIRILLIQAISEGPYRCALSKRGPGLHHIGAGIDRLKNAHIFAQNFRLFLHPFTLHSLDIGVAWLCRPGLPFLIELFESRNKTENKARLTFPVAADLPVHAMDLFANLELFSLPQDGFLVEENGQQLLLKL